LSVLTFVFSKFIQFQNFVYIFIKMLLLNQQSVLVVFLEVDRRLVKSLKSHQAAAIKFMWNACFESVAQIKAAATGLACILCHCMGFGKKFTVIDFFFHQERKFRFFF
jgi:hypothetical protein